MPKPPAYLVIIQTPKGVGEIEVPSFLGADAASRRAVFCAAAKGWGDLPDLKVLSSTLIPDC